MKKLVPCLSMIIAGALFTACGNGGGNADAGDGGDLELRDEGPDAADEETDADGDGEQEDACVSECGNGEVECDEECDDGNTTSGDGCSSTCTIEVPPNCGDGNVDYAEGEECDDGNTDDGDGCDFACRIETPSTCGDGILDMDNGEQCDDGNTDRDDGCSPACQYEPVGADCGNGSTENLEVCDDGNTANGDGCNPTCNLSNTTEPFVGSPGVPGRTDGTGSAALIGGSGTITADDEYLYLADGHNYNIRRIDIATRVVQTIAGDPGGTQGHLDAPIGTDARFGWLEAPATDGNTLWVADHSSIRAVELTAPFRVDTVAGSGTPGHADGFGAAAQFEDPRGLTYFRGSLYLVDSVTAVIRRFDPVTTEVTTLAGEPYQTGGADGFGSAARFQSPRYMTADNSGMLYIGDTLGNTIRSYNTATGYVGTFAGNGTSGYVDGIGTGALVHVPRGMTSDGTSIYWVEVEQDTVRQGILATAEVSTLVGTHCGGSTPCDGAYAEGTGTGALFDNPFSIVYHFPTNSLFVVDGNNCVIRRIF